MESLKLQAARIHPLHGLPDESSFAVVALPDGSHVRATFAQEEFLGRKEFTLT